MYITEVAWDYPNNSLKSHKGHIKKKVALWIKFILRAPFSHLICLQRKSPKFQKIWEIGRASGFSLVQDDVWIKMYGSGLAPLSPASKVGCGATSGEARGQASPIHSHPRAFGHRLPNFYLVFPLPWPSHQSAAPFPNTVPFLSFSVPILLFSPQPLLSSHPGFLSPHTMIIWGHIVIGGEAPCCAMWDI